MYINMFYTIGMSGVVEQEGRTQMQKLKFKRFIPKLKIAAMLEKNAQREN